MPLLVISDQTTMHIIFYVVFCFMSQKISFDYIWVLNQLKTVYVKSELDFSIVIVIDMKKRLMLTIRIVFSIINQLLCLWHISKNVLSNCKRSFTSKKTWDSFFAQWNAIIYAFSKTQFWDEWDKMLNKYQQSHEECMTYLTSLINHRRFFTRCYTNKLLHFETITTSRDEDAHFVLKRQLRTSIEDIKTMINDINLLLINEYTAYLMKINDDKIRLLMKLRKSIFQNLAAFVIIYVLRKIMIQFKLLTNQSTMMLSCINVFITIIELSCNHKIQKRLFDEECLMIDDVHSHWR